MSRFHQISSWWNYRRHAVNKHGVHSPFVFDLVTQVFPNRGENYSDHPAEKWRAECLKDDRAIEVTDFGTGTSGKRIISDIAARAAKKPEQGQLLHRIAQHIRPKRILELGTSLGITSTYLAGDRSFEKFISLEGCPNISALAKEHFSRDRIFVEVRTGEFSSTLKNAAADLGRIDLVYFDGNHRKNPTLEYLDTVLPYCHNETWLILDDIHWSDEMDDAWDEIRHKKEFHVTMDLYHFGIVIPRSQQKKEHFVLKW